MLDIEFHGFDVACLLAAVVTVTILVVCAHYWWKGRPRMKSIEAEHEYWRQKTASVNIAKPEADAPIDWKGAFDEPPFPHSH
jgi:hypothetical protein